MTPVGCGRVSHALAPYVPRSADVPRKVPTGDKKVADAVTRAGITSRIPLGGGGFAGNLRVRTPSPPSPSYGLPSCTYEVRDGNRRTLGHHLVLETVWRRMKDVQTSYVFGAQRLWRIRISNG